MADVVAPGSLGDFFAKNKKKKIKGSNLNTDAAKPTGDEQKKAAKDKEDADRAAESQAADTGLKVQVAGKLLREDDNKVEDDHAAPAWRTKNTGPKQGSDDRRFPSLRAATGQSSNINIDDGSNATVNIKTSKNVFQALHDDDDDEEEGPKRPKEIKPFLATKQKGEMMSTFLQREVDRYGVSAPKSAEPTKKKKKAKAVESSDSEEDSDEESKEEKQKKKDEKKGSAPKDQSADKELEEDSKIVPDLEASRKKYQGRDKLPKKKLPASELEEEKVAKPSKQAPVAATGGGKKGKKKNFADVEEIKPKMMVAPDDW